MIATDGDRRRQVTARHEVVERQTEGRAVALPQPADARRQALEVDALAREGDPAPQVLVVRKEIEHQLVGPRDVGGIAGESDPAERSLPLTEQRADVLGDETGGLETIPPP